MCLVECRQPRWPPSAQLAWPCCQQPIGVTDSSTVASCQTHLDSIGNPKSPYIFSMHPPGGGGGGGGVLCPGSISESERS